MTNSSNVALRAPPMSFGSVDPLLVTTDKDFTTLPVAVVVSISPKESKMTERHYFHDLREFHELCCLGKESLEANH